jgi:hypothetical protein
MHNGAETCVTGKFSRMDEDWVILTEAKDVETWIPRSVILLIKVDNQEPRPTPVEPPATSN